MGSARVVPIPARREHTVRNESGREARAFVAFSPGEAMERFVRAVAASGEAKWKDLLALASAHGIEMTRSLEVA